MSVPFLFRNRALPVSAFDIDAVKINADFAALSDGSAIDLGAIDLSKLAPDVLAAMGGFLMNFLINGSYESFSGSFQRWTFDNSADPTAVLSQASGPGNFRFGQRSAQITTGIGPAGTLLLFQSLQNPTDLAGLTMSTSVWVKAAAIGAIKVRIFDGLGSSVSAANVNSGVWEKLQVTHLTNVLNTELTVRVEVTQPGALALNHLVDGAMMVLGATAINYQPGLSPLDALAGVSQFYGVVPTPAPDGIITIFTSPVSYTSGKIVVSLRGLRMTPSVDYIEGPIVGTQITFLPVNIPQLGDNILIDGIEPLV